MACKGLDAQVVRPEDPELARLLDQFVPVRIVRFNGVDMNRFRFDYDLTFAVLMMAPDGHVYSRFGSQDWRSSPDRMSIPGLKNSMREVLALHPGRKPAPATAPAAKPFTLEDFPIYGASRQARADCAHCHFANNFRFRQLRAEGKFTKEMLFQYPLPENIGIELDVERNNTVKTLLPDSPAAKAGVRAGDVVTRADATPVLNAADLQWALNALPDPGGVSLILKRAGKALPPVRLTLLKGWRTHDVSWRASQETIPPTVGVWGRGVQFSSKAI